MFVVENLYLTYQLPIMKTNPTLKKIAEQLHLSISTVSRALKDHPDIAELTKRKVNELAELVEYDPNPYAVNLRTHNSKEFAVIVPSLSNFFYQSFIAAIEEQARKSGYSVMIFRSSDDPTIELELLKNCRHKRVSGIFIAITSQTTDIQPFLKLDHQGIPVVFFDKVPAYESCNRICVGDAHAAAIAAEHLLQKGINNVIGIFGDERLYITQLRLKKFQEILVNGSASLTILHASAADDAMKLTLKLQMPQNKNEQRMGIFCMSDEILTGTMKAVQRNGWKIPNELALISISDGMIPKLYFPEISYAETSGQKLGKLAFDRMMKCIQGSSFAQTIIDQSVLIEGGSVGF
jgi:LacI family transcriptional regulator